MPVDFLTDEQEQRYGRYSGEPAAAQLARGGIEHIRGSSSDSAMDTLLQRGLVVHNEHHLLVTTRAFLDLAGLRDLAELPPLTGAEEGEQSSPE